MTTLSTTYSNNPRSRRFSVGYKQLTTMRKFIIHLLGGFTKEECVQQNIEHYDLGCYNTADMFKRFADQMNGMPADDWCKMMYNHILGYIKRLENEETKTIHQEQ